MRRAHGYGWLVVKVVKWVDTTVRRRVGASGEEDGSRRAHVLLAAVEAIDEFGPNVGMAQIAERAAISRPNLYRHFDSKDELDAEVTRFAAADLVRRVRPTLARRGTMTQVTAGVIAPCVIWASEHPNLYRFLAAQRQTKALHRERTGRSRLLTELVEAMRAYLRPTELLHDPPEGVLAGLMGMVDASIIWWLDHQDETQERLVDRLSRQVTAVLMDMLSEIGLRVPHDMVFEPKPAGEPV